MKSSKHETLDLSVFGKINFENSPIGVKFNFFEPEGINPLSEDRELSFCEMLKEAQQTDSSFYFSKEYEETCVGKILLGILRKLYSSRFPISGFR